MIRWLLTTTLLLALLTACERSAPATRATSRVAATVTPLSSTATSTAPRMVPEPTQPTIPAGDPRVAGQRELLFAGLDLENEHATLEAVEPFISAETMGCLLYTSRCV